ncbi:MAG: glycosyltransferase family 2 protein [bacterium]|nr:glycosyltransferase family 2 protein [bacterium]
MIDLIILFCFFMLISLAVINIPFLVGGVIYYHRQNRHAETDYQAELRQSVSVLIPFHNEEKNLLNTLQSVMKQSAHIDEVILIDDGSTDDYERVLNNCFDFEKMNLPCELSDKVRECFTSKDRKILLYKTLNHGKCNALDTGFLLAKSELVVTVDADSFLLPGSVEKLTAPFSRDKNLIAAFGSLGILNQEFIREKRIMEKPRRTLLEKMQFCSTMNDFMLTPLFNVFDFHFCIVGAFAGFRKNAIMEIGGFSGRTLTEDRDICLDIYANSLPEKKGSIRHIPDAICLTELPSKYSGFIHQQTRWYGGWYQTLVKYKKLIFNPRMSGFGLVMLPILLLKAAITPLLWFNSLIIVVLLLFSPFSVPGAYFIALIVYWLIRFVLTGYYHIIWNRCFYTHRLQTPSEHVVMFIYYIFIYPFFNLFYSFLALKGFILFWKDQLKW